MGKMINHLEYGNIESIYFKKVIQIRKVVLVLKKGIQMSILKSNANVLSTVFFVGWLLALAG